MDVAELESEAIRLEAEGDRLIAKGKDLRIQASKYRARMDTLAREASKPRALNAPDPLLAAAGVASEELWPGFASGELADALEIEPARATRLLLELEARGAVKRTGQKSGTRWWPTEAEMPEQVVSPDVSLEVIFREAAQRLGTFTQAEIRAQVPVSPATASRYLKLFEARGILESEKVGTTLVYAFRKPDPIKVTRRREKSPEEALKGAQIGPARRGSPVALRKRRRGRKEVMELIREVEAAGGTVHSEGTHHLVRSLDGSVITTIPKTPSDWRGILNTRAELKRAGLVA